MPLTGAGQGIDAGARRFRGPGGPVTNTSITAPQQIFCILISQVYLIILRFMKHIALSKQNILDLLSDNQLSLQDALDSLTRPSRLYYIFC